VSKSGVHVQQSRKVIYMSTLNKSAHEIDKTILRLLSDQDVAEATYRPIPNSRPAKAVVAEANAIRSSPSSRHSPAPTSA
jgi:hypothetical protein